MLNTVLRYGIFSQGAAIAPSFPTSGLTSYWRLDSTAGTTAYDAVASVDGTLTTGSFNSGGKNNYCYYNTTVSSRAITFGNVYNFERTDTWSGSAWIKMVTVAGEQFIMTKVNNYSPWTGWYFSQNFGTNLSFWLLNNLTSNALQVSTDFTFSTDTWYHVVFTYNGNSDYTGVKLYINADSKTINVSRNSLTASIQTESSTNFCIGGRHYGSGIINGYTDEVALWDRVLSQEEVTTIYNSGSGLFY